MQELTIILLCFAAAGFGAEPPTQMATLRRRGDGEFMSWRWEKLGEAFEDGAARFAADSRIVSPTWAELDVLGAEVTLRCSTNAPSRFLQVSFLRDGKAVSGPIRFEAAFAADTRESQTLAVSRAKHANGIALSLSTGTHPATPCLRRQSATVRAVVSESLSGKLRLTLNAASN